MKISSTAVINLINGLFETDHPLDSVITYNWTEHIGDDMRTCLADTIITISHDKQSVNQHSENLMHQTLYFPEPKVIILYSKSPAPDEYILNLDSSSEQLTKKKML